MHQNESGGIHYDDTKNRDENYDGPERRQRYFLSDSDVDRIARRVIVLAGEQLVQAASKKALDEVFVAVGKGVLARFLWLLGIVGAVAIAWATKNHIDFK